MAKQTAAPDDLDIFDLLAEIEKKKQPAIDALLAQREEINSKLTRLGYTDAKPVLTPKSAPTKAVKGKRDSNTPCPFCGELGHDARKHRSEIIAAKKAAQA